MTMYPANLEVFNFTKGLLITFLIELVVLKVCYVKNPRVWVLDHYRESKSEDSRSLKQVKFSALAGYAFLLNLLTWPLVQLLYTGSPLSFFILEAGVVLVEGAFLKYLTKSSFTRAFLSALTANGVSAAVGSLFF